MYTLRPYQQRALDALHTHICTKSGNPCVVLPTGAGKSVVMASAIHRWKEDAPWLRVCVLAHRKELVVQNASKLRSAYSDGEVGIFSAGLGQKDYDAPILYASIDSIYRRAGEFPPFHALFVDEAHRIPPRGEGKYRTFINECRRFNKDLKVVGWTATPFRMGCGKICHRDHILNEVCVDVPVTELINDGYLCRLRSKVGEAQPQLASVKRNSGGDYILKSLSQATNSGGVVTRAVQEIVRIMNAENRRAAAIFCVDLEHCKAVHAELRRAGVFAPQITGKTPHHERDQIVAEFRAGRLRGICSVGVLTEGFDSPNIDCIVLLRPTLSRGLYAQMVGRGLRPHQSKQDCLVLDFAGCIAEHGPIDLLDGDPIVMATCAECRESFSRAIGECPVCGWQIPKQEIERLEATERERRMHGDKASRQSILSEPETHKVDAIIVSRHQKVNNPDSLLVQYRCGMSMFREWVCLDHEGFAGKNAHQWWRARFPDESVPSVDDAIGDMFLSQRLLEWTKTVTVARSGRYFDVVDYNRITVGDN